jgi:hypothetical protein
MRILEAFWRDANNVPITTDGLITTDVQTLVGNNTTVNVPIFTIQGSIEVRGLWGEVTTVLGANNTAAYWRFNDQTNQSNITVNTGTTLSAAAVGSLIVKKGLAAAALTLLSASQERVSEPTTLETPYFSPFTLTALPTATSNIEFTYTTTDTPTSGQIRFYLRWLPITNNANVIAL